MYICFMELKDYIGKHRIILREDYIPEYSPFEILDEDGDIVAHYYEDGYEYISAYVSLGEYSAVSAFNVAYRTAINVTALNMGLEYSILCEYMDLTCKKFFDTDKLSVSRDSINKAIERTLNGENVARLSKANYIYVGKAQFYNKEQKLDICRRNNAKTKKMKTLKSVETAVGYLSGTNFFITNAMIKQTIEEMGLEISDRNVSNYIKHFREEISEHNNRIFGTDNYGMYKRMCTVLKVVDAIKALSKVDEKLSQRNVADKAEIHYNTVNNVWQDDDVQEALNNYNKVVV